MTVKIKTRVEAQHESIHKWNKFNEAIQDIMYEVETFCGYCILAKTNVPKTKKPHAHLLRCDYCEADAKRLCERYVTVEQLIPDALTEAQKLIANLLKKITDLPKVLE